MLQIPFFLQITSSVIHTFSRAWHQGGPWKSTVRTSISFQLLQNVAAACLLKDLRQMDHINICVLWLALATRVLLDAVQRTDFDLWCCVHFKPETIYPKKKKNHPQWARWNRAAVEAAPNIILSLYLYQPCLPIHCYLGNSAQFPSTPDWKA